MWLVFQLLHHRRLLSFILCRFLLTIFFAIINNAVDHTVIIFKLHFRIFQIILRDKSGKFLKAGTITVITGYRAIFTDGNNVANRKAVTLKIFRTIQIKFLEDAFQKDGAVRVNR